MRVVHYQRKPRLNANYSLEFIFSDVRRRLARDAFIEHIESPCFSNGVLPRLRIMLHASRNQGDVTHVTGDINFAVILLNRNRSILTVLDCGFVKRTRGLRSWLLKWFWLKLPLRRVACVTTISSAAKREIIEHSGCDEDFVEVIPVAISPEFTQSFQVFNSESPRILHVGTAPNKNLHRLLEALKGLHCELTIIGKLDAKTISLLSQYQINSRNLVSLTSEQVVSEYRRCDVLAFCSTYEGFGMPILEAQATGRVVITSNLSSMPEVAGDAACFVDPFDTESIRKGLLQVISDAKYRERLIELGIENTRRFDAEVIARKDLELYTRVAARTQSPGFIAFKISPFVDGIFLARSL